MKKSSPIPPPRFYNIAQAEGRLGVSTDTIRRLIKADELHKCEKYYRVMIPVNEVENYGVEKSKRKAA